MNLLTRLGGLAWLAWTAAGCLFLVNEHPDGSGGGAAGTGSSSGGGGAAGTGGAPSTASSTASTGGSGPGGCDAQVVSLDTAAMTAEAVDLVVSPRSSLNPRAFVLNGDGKIVVFEISLEPEPQLTHLGDSIAAYAEVRLSPDFSQGAVLVLDGGNGFRVDEAAGAVTQGETFWDGEPDPGAGEQIVSTPEGPWVLVDGNVYGEGRNLLSSVSDPVDRLGATSGTRGWIYNQNAIAYWIGDGNEMLSTFDPSTPPFTAFDLHPDGLGFLISSDEPPRIFAGPLDPSVPRVLGAGPLANATSGAFLSGHLLISAGDSVHACCLGDLGQGSCGAGLPVGAARVAAVYDGVDVPSYALVAAGTNLHLVTVTTP